MRKPEGLWFGADHARCFGMLHQPAAPQNRNEATRGVVLCNAFGYEGLLSYRAFRHIADGVAARGQWALRFDYDGEGDSAGGAWEPDRVDAWMASIDAAVSVLRARGVTDVRLAGFRIGATLAARYATTHPGISGLALWAPCERGAAYVREQRVRARMSSAARPAQPTVSTRFPEDSLEAVGFELTGETLRAIGEIDLVAEPFPCSPPSVLVIDRDDAPPADELVQRFEAAGAKVTHDHMSGYEDFITDGEENAATPVASIALMQRWLDAAPAADPADTVSDPALVVESSKLAIDDPPADRSSPSGPAPDAVVEETVWIDDRFFAICSSPAGRSRGRGATIILPNTGSVCHIGPGRLYVTLARYWASLGFTVVRVDLGHAGDSIHVDPATENNPHGAARREELRDIVTWVRNWTGNDHVVAGGMCSGAFLSLHLTMNGADLDHVLIVNPAAFYLDADAGTSSNPKERAFHSAHALTRGFTDFRKWKLALRDPEIRRRGIRSVRSLFRANAMSGFRVLLAGSARKAARRLGMPVKSSSVLAHDLAAVIARGGKVLLVFSTGESSATYFRTFGGPECETLANGAGLDVINIEGGDHVFSPPASREQLVAALTAYLTREYPT